MSTSINTNISAMAAQSSLRKTGLAQATSMERLSTGVRINNAKDDAAGLAITTRMTANIRGMAAAIRNSNDGISLTQTAEGSLSAIQDNLQRIRELSVQSANSGNTQSDRNSLNLEAQQLISEIDRVATGAAFNGSKLLDGTFKDQDFQVGAGNDSADRIRISIGSAKAAALGTVGSTSTSYVSSSQTNGAGDLLAGDVAIKGFAVSPSVSDGVSFLESAASALAKANAINASSALTGVTATADTTSVASGTITGTVAVSAGSLTVNGVDIGSLQAAANVTDRANQLVAAINAISAQTGVSATNAANAVTMTASDGRNITYQLSAAATAAGLGGFNTVSTAVTTRAAIKLYSNADTTIAITGSATAKIGTTQTVGGANVSLSSSTVTGKTVSSVDISSATGAQRALTILDSAIDTITNSRANLGAYQNRFSAAISNLETTSTNLQASRSRILDTDYAKETTSLAKAQIITQAATAMLAQANQSAQSVLALLK